MGVKMCGDGVGHIRISLREPAEKEPWSVTHEALSKAIRRAAKVALSKDPARVQKYLMSGQATPTFSPHVTVVMHTLPPFPPSLGKGSDCRHIQHQDQPK